MKTALFSDGTHQAQAGSESISHPQLSPRSPCSSQYRDQNQDHGFSLVELIVTVLIIGIIVAIAIPVFLNTQDNARQAAVESAARDGQVMARASIIDGSSPHGGDLSVLETEDIVLNLANSFVPGDESTVCVRADWLSADNYSISGPCEESDTTAPIVDREDDDPLYTQLTYQCPTDRTGYLGIVNVGNGTRVHMWEEDNRDATIREVDYGTPDEDFELRYRARQEMLRTETFERTGSIEAANALIDQATVDANSSGPGEEFAPEYSQEETVENASERVEMEGDVTYTVRFDGEVETFAAPGHEAEGTNTTTSIADCLVSIDHFGDDINLKNIVYLGRDRLTAVPDSIPSSVLSLRAAFQDATQFNDPNVSNWNVDNVYSIRSMFYRADSFNQNLSNWNTSNVNDARMMFLGAATFNNGEEPGQSTNPLDWSVGNVDNVNNMFNGAVAFNQDIGGWDTSNVTRMDFMFRNATRFNQNLNDWDTSSVVGHNGFNADSGLGDSNMPTFD